MGTIVSFDPEKMKGRRFKVIFAGDSGVGKSSIIYRFIHGKYNGKSDSTIGVAYSNHHIYMSEYSRTLNVDLWDTAGQERFDAIIPRYFRGSSGIVVVFDLTDHKTLSNARKRWLQKIKRFSSDSNPVVAIVGNKSDLFSESEERAVDIVEDLADFYRKELGLTVLSYISSAKSGENIHKLFEETCCKIFKQHIRREVCEREFEVVAEEPQKTCCGV